MFYSITMGALKENILVSDTPWGLLCIYFHILALAITFSFYIITLRAVYIVLFYRRLH